MDPLLSDAYEKKLKIRKHICCLMEELKDTRNRLAMQEERVVLEMRRREEAETKANRLEEDVGALHALVDKKDKQLQAVASSSAQISAPTQWTMEALSTAGPTTINCFENDLFGLLLEKIESINYILKAKERELATLRKKFRMLSAYWKFKIKDLETKLETNRDLDEGMNKRVLKLETFLQKSQSQLLALQKIEAKRDETIKELTRSIAGSGKQHRKDWNFTWFDDIWNASCTKFAVSISVTVILIFVLSNK